MALFRAMMLLVCDWAAWPFWTGTESGYCQTITWTLGYCCSIHPSFDVDCSCNHDKWQIKALEVVVITDDNNRLPRCAGVRGPSLGVLSTGTIPIMVIELLDCGGGPVGCSDWLSVRGAVVIRPGRVRIGYIRRARTGNSSLDAAPVTGSLVFSVPVCCLAGYCAAEFYSWLFGGTVCIWLAGGELCCQRVRMELSMATDGAAVVDARAGITFGVELHVPWDAPEAVVGSMVNLGSIPDVIGLTGRRPSAAECRVLQGRYVRSVRVLVPDPRGLDKNFHDVTIVNMGEFPESAVSLEELSLLRQQWPPAILRHMVWLQQDREVMRTEAKKWFRNDIIFAEHMMFCGWLNRPVWSSSFPHGQFGVKCGRIR